MTERLIAACATVELLVVVVVQSALVETSLQSADAVEDHLRREVNTLRPCTDKLCRVRTNSARRPASTASVRQRRESGLEAVGDLAFSELRRNGENERKKRGPLKLPQPKPQPPTEKVKISDKSVAEVLAMSVNVGRGQLPQPPPANPTARQPVSPPSGRQGAAKVKATAAPKASGGGGQGTGGGGGRGDLVNVMLALGCEAEPCQHGGVCFTDAFSARGFSCRCTTGRFGDVCEYDTELCISGPCLNDAKCLRDPIDPSGYVCDCAPGFYGLHCERELTHEALEMMDVSNSMSRYYSLTANPLLLQLTVAACALLVLIVFITFICCIEIRRDSIVEKRKLLRSIGLDMEFPRISLIGIACKLILSCLMCRCCVSTKRKDSGDPRANIPLIMPASAPPLPRTQNNNAALQQLLMSPSHVSQMSDVLSAGQWQQLQQLEAQRAYSIQRQIQLQQLQQQLLQQQQQQQQPPGYPQPAAAGVPMTGQPSNAKPSISGV